MIATIATIANEEKQKFSDRSYHSGHFVISLPLILTLVARSISNFLTATI